MEDVIAQKNIEIQKLQQKNSDSQKYINTLIEKNSELNSLIIEYVKLDGQKSSEISHLKNKLTEKNIENEKLKTKITELENKSKCNINITKIQDTNLNNLKISQLRDLIQMKNINIKSRKRTDLIHAILDFDKKHVPNQTQTLNQTQTQTLNQTQTQTLNQTQTQTQTLNQIQNKKDYTKMKLVDLKKICQKNNIFVQKTREKKKYIDAIEEFEEDKLFEENKKIEQNNQRQILEQKISNIQNQIKCSSCSNFYDATTSKIKCSCCPRSICECCEDIFLDCKYCNMKFCSFCLENDKCIKCNNFFEEKKENATVHYIENIYEFPENIPTKEYNNGDLVVDKLNFNTKNDITNGVYIVKIIRGEIKLENIDFRDKIISSYFSLGPNKPPNFWSRCELEGSWPLWPLPEPISINYFKHISKNDLVEIENKVFRFSLDWIDIYFESSSKENIIRNIGKAIYNNEKVLYFETLIDSKKTRPNNNYQSYFL